MKFLALGIEDIPGFVAGVIRSLCALLCELFYPLIADLYEVFREMGKLFYSDTFSSIYNKISLLLGIYMVFRITFWLIEMLVNPDKVSDKEKNPTKIITRTLIVVVMLAITPTVFEYAFKLQYEIIDSNIIESLFTFNEENYDNNDVDLGNFLSANLFDNFYDLNTENSDKCLAGDKDGVKSYTETLRQNGELYISNECLTETFSQKNADNEKEEIYVLNFNGLFAVLVGGFVAWTLLMYCISLGTRYIQLIFLQVVAPIPIMCYVAPGKDNMFEKWIKQCTTTYLDLFIRVAIISFAMMLCQVLFASDLLSIPGFDGSWIIEIFIILGLLTFAKKAPDLIQELLPKSVTKASGDFGLSWKKRTDSMLGGKYIYNAPKKAIGFGLASMDTLRRVGVRAYDAHKYNQRNDEQLRNYRNRQIDKYQTALDRVRNNQNLTSADRKRAEEKIQSRIDSLKNMSDRQLRRNLHETNKGIKNALLNPKRDLTAEEKAKLYNRYTENVNSGMGHRNQASTFATSVSGGLLGAADSALHNNKISDIVKKNAQATTKFIDSEQKWYASNSYTAKNVMQRTVSEIQRKWGIETEGQAVQYAIDALNAEVKFKEESLSKEKEKQQVFSTIASTTDNVEKKGTSDVEKNKKIIYRDSNGNDVEVTYNSDILSMESSHTRLTDNYTNLSVAQSTASINDKTSAVHVSNIKSMLKDICDKTGNSSKYNELASKVDNCTNLGLAYNFALTESRQMMSKNKSDKGKLQGAAGVLTGIIREGDSSFTGGFSSIGIENEWRSMERTFTSPENSSSLSFEVEYEDLNGARKKCKAYELPSKVRELADIGYVTEDRVKSAQKLISLMKDVFERETGKQSAVVASVSEEVQDMKYEVSAFSKYSETTDAINADKYNGGK